MAGPSGPVAERRIASHGDWKDNVLFACVAWLLFSFRLLATKLLSAPLYKTWLHTQTHGRRLDHEGTGGTNPTQNLERGTLMQIVPPPQILPYKYKNERSVAFKIRQNPFSAGALTPLEKLTTLPQTPWSSGEGSSLPIPHPTRHGSTFGALHATPRSPARSTPMRRHLATIVDMFQDADDAFFS